MRLQVSVRRHAFPATNIIFITGTGPSSKTLAPTSTVTDLLYDVNDLVPLESADGEWGLEDYVVEVQATADQEIYYECLHYQTIESVLREDDEVIIRSLGTEDLRVRRLSGRHQISTDGRHLIDGVAFGRQWLRKGGRPGINIPPRKRRRLEIDGEDDEELTEESTTPLEQLKERVRSNGDLDEEEEDDMDFEDDVNGEEIDETSDDDEDEQHMRIKATAEFDNADVDKDEDEISEEDSDNKEEQILTGNGLELSEELKALLVEAEQLSENDTYNRLPLEAVQSPRKRKRDEEEEDVEDSDAESASDFEGFLTPIKMSQPMGFQTSPPSSVDMLDDTTVPSDSSSDSDSDNAPAVENTSSSGSSDSEHTSSSDSSLSNSEDDSSSSDSSSDSSTGGSTKPKNVKLPSSSPAKQTPSQAHSSSSSSKASLRASTTSPIKRQEAPPGQGSNVTHRNNQRTHRRQRLARLKRQGLLPPDADFSDMSAFDEYNNAQFLPDDQAQLETQDDFESKKAALLQQLYVEDQTTLEIADQVTRNVDNVTTVVDVVMQLQGTEMELAAVDQEPKLETSNKVSIPEKETSKENIPVEDVIEVDEIVFSQEIGARAQESFIGKATPKSTEKRAKLDLASSRRMLFNSLGLRTPNTPEAEQALREKLAKDIKKPPQRRSDERASKEVQLDPTSNNDMDSWKDRIVLSAVECEYEGVILSAPPFPFKQGWDSNASMRHGANKKKGRKQSKDYDYGDDHVQEYAPDVSTFQNASQDTPLEQDDRPDSRTLSLEEQQEPDDMPRPSGIQDLLNLGIADLAPGAVIAFKELHIHNFQPVVSDYRVARVQASYKDGSADVVEIMLSKKDWPAESTEPDPYAMEDEDKQSEDGLRTMGFTDLLEPKLVEASSVQVNATPAEPAEKDNLPNLPEAQSSVVPESAEAAQDTRAPSPLIPKTLIMTHVEINTPRRNEITAIIKEAGFDSAIDKDLVQPEDELEPQPQSSPAFHTRSHRSHSPAAASTHATATSLTGPRFDSPGLNGRDSSPLRQIQADSSMIEPSQASPQATPSKSRLETQSSIAYPALSQLDIDPSGVTVTNESSFQDAQRVSPPPDFDTSALRPDLDTSKLHPDYPYDDYGNDETQASHASEVPQTQSTEATPNAKYTTTSFLGHGLDGHVSSDDEASDYVSSDDFSLPSLRELTSSQNKKIKHSSRRSGASHATIPPPAVHGKRLRNGKKHSASPSDNDIELPPVEISASQIPVGSQIVDLTFSSSQEKPLSDGGEYRAPRTRGAKMKKGRMTRGGSGESDGEEEVSTGIEKRRFLTTKKWGRSHA